LAKYVPKTNKQTNIGFNIIDYCSLKNGEYKELLSYF
jgi:hypothetical protein